MNHSTVFILALFHYVIGLAWYSPGFFGRIRDKEFRLSDHDKQKILNRGFPQTIFISFLPSWIISYALAYFVLRGGHEGFLAGAEAGAIATIGFVVPISVTGVFWGKSSIKGFVINMAYYLLTLSSMGGILAAWL